MMKLFCVVVGAAGSAFSVEVNAGDSVDDLKQVITRNSPQTFAGDAKQLRLYLAKKGDEWMPGDDAAVMQLEEGRIHGDIQAILDGDELDEMSSIQDCLDGEAMPTPTLKQLHVLVVDPTKHFIGPDARPPHRDPLVVFYDGINPRAPHLARGELLSRVYASLHHAFVLFMSPGLLGKTSLLKLFARRYPHVNCIPISFLHGPRAPAIDQLHACGIDVFAGTTRLNPHQQHVVMIDDAQSKYEDADFWNRLIKLGPTWLPRNICFFIAARHVPGRGQASAGVFASLPTFGERNLLVSDEEARAFLLLPSPTGLPHWMRYQTFIDVVICSCRGYVGTLRDSVDLVSCIFAKAAEAPSEIDLIEYYLSRECQQSLRRPLQDAYSMKMKREGWL